MNATLRQRKAGLARKEFFLGDESLLIRETKRLQQWEYHVRYEDIGFETMIKRDIASKYAHYPLSVLSLATLLLIVACALRPGLLAPVSYVSLGIWTLLLSFMTAKAWLQRNTVYEYLTGGAKTLEFFRHAPDEADYTAFINALYSRIRATHRKRLLDDADMNLPMEMHEAGIAWLKKIHAVNEDDIRAFERRLAMYQKRQWN